MNMTAVRRKRKLSRQLPLPRLLAVAFAFAGTLLFLALVLLSTSPPSPSPHRHIVATGFSSSRRPPPCGAVSLGDLGDMMVSMVPKGLPFTVFVPSTESFLRVLKLRPNGKGAAGGETASDTDTSTYAVLSRVLGFSAVPRRVLSADVPPRGPVRLLDSVSGLRIYASRDASGALVVNGLRSECVDIVRGEAVVHVMAGVLMDAEFERSSSPEFGD